VSAPAAPETIVKPAYGPSLPQLLRARFGLSTRVATGVAIAVVVLVVAAALALRGGDVHLVHRDAPVFNLRYAKVLHRMPPEPGVVLGLEGRRGDLFLQSLTIRRLHLPRYPGAVSGFLPLYSEHHIRALTRRFDGFTPLEEGKARINEAPGYQVGFRAQLDGRTVYGREVLLVPDEPGARDGVAITVLQTHAAGAHAVKDVGTVGAIKKPFRSFRFGTEAK
jgi:hypothetical protein